MSEHAYPLKSRIVYVKLAGPEYDGLIALAEMDRRDIRQEALYLLETAIRSEVKRRSHGRRPMAVES